MLAVSNGGRQWACMISASLDHRDSRPQSPRTRGDGWTAASLQYISDVRINLIVAFFATCSLAPDNCRRVAGWQIRVSLGACRARDCTLPMFYV